MNNTTASENGAEDRSLGPLRVGDVVAEKYVVERTLGVGGMGVVVQARDQVLDRPVAIKFLLPKLTGSETAVQRFVREARAATRITSEHVVRLLEIEKLPTGTPFFVMEYLDGCDLRTLIREQGALPAALAVDYVLQALQAVAEGHVRGIVHRDIKPGNLFLTRRADGTPLIKVLDFGIAKTAEGDAAESTSLTSSDDVRLGSPAYMPPEQLQNPRDVDLRSDIWSLGATLYELICGRPPFEGAGYLDLATHVLNRPPAPFAQHGIVDVPEGLERVVRRCLEKERSLRYPNAQELATALAPFGSADARMSLTRVSGMFTSSGSLPALTRAIAADPSGYEPTLDVSSGASGRPPSGDRHATKDIQGKTPSSWARRGAAVVLAAVLGAGALYVFRPQSPGGVSSGAPVQPASSAQALELPAVAPVSKPSAVAPLPTERAAVPPTPSVASASASAPQKKRAPRVAVASATLPAPSVVAVPETTADVSKSRSPGRSEEIERLIQQRR